MQSCALDFHQNLLRWQRKLFLRLDILRLILIALGEVLGATRVSFQCPNWQRFDWLRSVNRFVPLENS